MPYGVDPNDAMIMARTMWGENTHATPDEYAAIASVMKNRQQSGDPQYGGNTMSQIALAPNQFQAWNDPSAKNYPMKAPIKSPAFQSAYSVASNILGGQYDDPTGGAVNYHATSMKQLPRWAAGRQGQQIGAHTFYGPQKSPGLTSEDQESIDKYYPKTQQGQGDARPAALTDEDQASIDKFYPTDKKSVDVGSPNAKVAGAFEQTPSVAFNTPYGMEPPLKEVGPSSETLAKLIGVLYGGAGAFGAAKGLHGIIRGLPTSAPQIAKALLKYGAIGAGYKTMGEVFGPEKGGAITDLVRQAMQHATEAAP